MPFWPNSPRSAELTKWCTSLTVDAEALLTIVRGPWGIENDLHRTLDV